MRSINTPALTLAAALTLSACPKHESAEPVQAEETTLLKRRDAYPLNGHLVLTESQFCQHPDPSSSSSILVLAEHYPSIELSQVSALEYPFGANSTETGLMLANFRFEDPAFDAKNPNLVNEWRSWNTGTPLPSCAELAPCFTTYFDQLPKNPSHQEADAQMQTTNLCVQEAMRRKNPGVQFD